MRAMFYASLVRNAPYNPYPTTKPGDVPILYPNDIHRSTCDDNIFLSITNESCPGKHKLTQEPCTNNRLFAVLSFEAKGREKKIVNQGPHSINRQHYQV